MRRSFLLLLSLSVLFLTRLQFQAHAAPAVSLIRQFSSLLRWPKSSSRTPQSDGNFLQYEEGYLVETVVEGNAIGVVPYKIRVSEDGELYAVDSVNSNIVKITPPLSQYSRARLIAGSFQGYTGHVDGKPSEARFNRPRGVTMDDKGNVYVADTSNLAIRKIGEGGVTTIAGGKSNMAGYRDGPSEGAMFSTDFDVIYVRPTCSLLVVDRGNAALRQISLNQEDCNYEYSSISTTDVTLVFVAVLIGYATCMLQQGFKPSFLSKLGQKYSMEGNTTKIQQSKEKPTPVVETVKPELEAGWPSFGILVVDLTKLALEALGSVLLYLVPVGLRPDRLKGGLTPLKDSLIMPEDEPESMSAQKQRTPTPLTETRQVQASPTGAEKYSEPKPTKMRSSSSLKDPSLSSKHRSSKRQEYSEFYGSGEVPPGYSQHSRSKSQKERTKHRQREKSGEVGFGGVGMEQKPVEQKPVNYEDPNFTHYRNNKYGDSYRFQ